MTEQNFWWLVTAVLAFGVVAYFVSIYRQDKGKTFFSTKISVPFLVTVGLVLLPPFIFVWTIFGISFATSGDRDWHFQLYSSLLWILIALIAIGILKIIRDKVSKKH